MFHNRSINARINKLHARALRLFFQDYTASFEELLTKDESVTIHVKNLQALATEMFKGTLRFPYHKKPLFHKI